MQNYLKQILEKYLAVKIKTSPLKVDDSYSLLKQKVERGTEKAIKEYGYVFKKLAEFDRS